MELSVFLWTEIDRKHINWTCKSVKLQGKSVLWFTACKTTEKVLEENYQDLLLIFVFIIFFLLIIHTPSAPLQSTSPGPLSASAPYRKQSLLSLCSPTLFSPDICNVTSLLTHNSYSISESPPLGFLPVLFLTPIHPLSIPTSCFQGHRGHCSHRARSGVHTGQSIT